MARQCRFGSSLRGSVHHIPIETRGGKKLKQNICPEAPGPPMAPMALEG